MKKISLLLLCMISVHLLADHDPIVTYVSPRSESVNVARILCGWQWLTHRNVDYSYLVADLCPEVTYTFRPDRIADCFFGKPSDCKGRIFIAGTKSTNRPPDSLIADYFGLPSDYHSCLLLHPSVTNTIVHGDAFLALNSLAKGLFLFAHLPLVYTRWHFAASEDVCLTGSGSFVGYAMGCATSGIEPLQNARFACGSLRKTKLAELIAGIGYDVALADWYHLGISIRTAVPFGNKPCGTFLFEPIVGNGHHWEIGMGLSGHVLFVHNPEKNHEIGLYGIAAITHQCKTTQRRTFDLCDKPLSRYYLAERVSQEPEQRPTISPVANLTTLAIEVDARLQIDVAIALGYREKQWSWLFGFGLWERSCESIKLCEEPFANGPWRLKEEGILLTPDILNKSSAQNHNRVEKLFGQVTYESAWGSSIPTIGFGGQVEFGGATNPSRSRKKECINCALSQWSIWLKGGITFE